eukprot:1157263-Pelagomonas_calceolata.AAC.20
MSWASKLCCSLVRQLPQQAAPTAWLQEAAGAAMLSAPAPASVHTRALRTWAAAAAAAAAQLSPSTPLPWEQASSLPSTSSIQGPGCPWPACSRVLRHGFHTSSPAPSKSTATPKKTAAPPVHGQSVDPSKGFVHGGYTVDMVGLDLASSTSFSAPCSDAMASSWPLPQHCN